MLASASLGAVAWQRAKRNGIVNINFGNFLSSSFLPAGP